MRTDSMGFCLKAFYLREYLLTLLSTVLFRLHTCEILGYFTYFLIFMFLQEAEVDFRLVPADQPVLLATESSALYPGHQILHQGKIFLDDSFRYTSNETTINEAYFVMFIAGHGRIRRYLLRAVKYHHRYQPHLRTIKRLPAKMEPQQSIPCLTS